MAIAEEIRTIRIASPEWNKFTNRDGTGLYHDIIRAIFEPLGIEVIHEYMPANRSLELVAQGMVDMKTCETNPIPGTFLSKHALYENVFHTLFHKGQLEGWAGPHTLRNREVVIRAGYYTEADFPFSVELKKVYSGVQAIDLILLNRADFYVDDINLIRQNLEATELKYNPDDFVIRPVGSRRYRPAIHDSPRGRTIGRILDQGIERLHRSGNLQTIFHHYGFPYPNYDFQ